MRYNLLYSVAFRLHSIFITLSHKQNDFRKVLFKTKFMIWFSKQIFAEALLG